MRNRRVALVLGVVLALSGVAFSLRSLRTELLHPLPSTLVLDRHGDELGELPGFREARGYWPLPVQLPARMVQATLETEDRGYYQHRGVSLRAIARAMLQNLRNLHVVSGASTLAMQVARLQSPARRNLFHKAKEALEALVLVHRFGHDAVLRQYLTLAPYANNVHGVTRAARFYFDKPVEDLSWAQAAFLAGLPQQPGRMNPSTPEGLRRGRARETRILEMLHARGVIDATVLAQSRGEDLRFSARPRRRPEMVHVVLDLGAQARAEGRYLTTSTVDATLQHAVTRTLKANLASAALLGANNTAGIVLDVASGEVLAAVGSADYFDATGKGAINFLHVKRSPGSALKPFLYALALQSRAVTAATELPDTPMDFQAQEGRGFLPENINHTFLGPVLMRDALGNSRNIPALRILSEVGVPRALELFRQGGVRDISPRADAYGLGLATGNLPVTVEELAGLYLMLAHEGERVPLRRFLNDAPSVPERILARDSAQMIRHVLADANARRPSFPAGSALDFDHAVAIKTGTSAGYRDAWAAAFNDRLLVVVWVGNSEFERMNDLGGLTGAGGAAHEILQSLTAGYQPYRTLTESFPPPDGWVPRTLCSLSGRLAGPHCPHPREEFFATGTEPLEGCPFHRVVGVDVRNGLRANAACPARFVTRRPMIDLPERYTRWARTAHLDVAPTGESPLCHFGPEGAPRVRIEEPRNQVELVFDPETPAELSTLRLSAKVTPLDAELVWLVDGEPVAKVRYPFDYRWPIRPGTHVISATLANEAVHSGPVTVRVAD